MSSCRGGAPVAAGGQLVADRVVVVTHRVYICVPPRACAMRALVVLQITGGSDEEGGSEYEVGVAKRRVTTARARASHTRR